MYQSRTSAFLVVWTWFSCSGHVQPITIDPSCDSVIYCQGDLLHAVQTQKIFEDSKTFVDLKLKTNEQVVLSKFDELRAKYASKIPNKILSSFVDEYFVDCSDDPSCKELLPWNPNDWSDNPPVLDKIKDPDYKEFASDLNAIWKKLARIMDVQVKEDANLTSLIYLPNGFMIPGGRFKEMYYFDTYWIVKGLLVSGMVETAKGIINNCLSLVKRLGHIPNGSRVYYKQRSQPPLLAMMIEAYVAKTGDKSMIKESLELLDREMEYFISNRQVDVKKNGKTYKMYRYFAVSSGPRPESYREDYEHGQKKGSEEERAQFYIALKSGAESGWDFSSRWFIKNRGNRGTILDTRTPDIIPVDLNAILHKTFTLLSEWYKEYRSVTRAEYFEEHAQELLTGLNEVLWNEEDGIWFDYDNANEIPRKYFFPSNFAPLWTGSYTFDKKILTDNVMNYVLKINLKQYIGGTPTSESYSGEQWDYPNAWPPLQSIVIQGLDNLGVYNATEFAYHLANQWLKSLLAGYKKYGKMFEKYDALKIGEPGSGGEYTDQDGFGWTNGFALELLEKYGQVIQWDQSIPVVVSNKFNKRYTSGSAAFRPEVSNTI
ncbi:trehalase (brush-border membrane glycoprotein) [Nesidiocoris tenuis]|uniref:Trehalase n=2 Tax=Nesidiocoris tenuis TaxID=355587 RepID=A0ABN7B7X8_9HEMI|nr:trehalase (brush-border membrane glycoprotein) [Nesidiocoris tenuis]